MLFSSIRLLRRAESAEAMLWRSLLMAAPWSFLCAASEMMDKKVQLIQSPLFLVYGIQKPPTALDQHSHLLSFICGENRLDFVWSKFRPGEVTGLQSEFHRHSPFQMNMAQDAKRAAPHPISSIIKCNAAPVQCLMIWLVHAQKAFCVADEGLSRPAEGLTPPPGQETAVRRDIR